MEYIKLGSDIHWTDLLESIASGSLSGIKIKEAIICSAITTVLGLIYIVLLFRNKRYKHFNSFDTKKAKLLECQRDLLKIINEQNCDPLLLRLAWSEAATFDRTKRRWPDCGGCIGALQYECMYDNKVHPEVSQVNAGLNKAIILLKPLKALYNNYISWADLIQLGGILAVKHAGGPTIPMIYGRVDVSLNELLAANINPNKLLPCSTPPYHDGKLSCVIQCVRGC